MLHWVIGTSTKYRILVLAFALAVMTFGIARLPDISVEALPDFGPVRVEIQTEALGLSPEEVENLITNPMEQEFFTGIPWLHKIRSNSAPGVSSVEMIFEPGTNDVRARQVVQERLTMVPALPAVSKPPFVLQPVATTSRLLMFTLSSKDVSLVDMSVLARWKIRQRLLSVTGVSAVSIWGLRDRQLQVLIDPHRLRLNRVTAEDVIRTAANAMWSSPLTFVEASTPGTGGFIETAHQRIAINHTQPIKTAAELGRVTIEGNRPVPLTIDEVATVTEGHPLLIGDAIVDGGPGLMIVVERFPGTSVGQVMRDVEQALGSMRPGLQGIDIDTSVFRATNYVEAAHQSLVERAGLGLLLLAVAIGVVLLNWRTALVSLVSFAASLLLALWLLSAFGLMLNLMIVAGIGLALVLVVDDSVVVVDNIRRRLADRDAAAGPAIRVLIGAAAEVSAPLLTALVVVALTAAPVLGLTGVDADLVQPLVLSYLLVVCCSMLVALTVTPALYFALFGPRAPVTPASPPVRFLARAYVSVLRTTVERWEMAVAVMLMATAAGVAALLSLRAPDLLPALKDPNVVVRMQATAGTSLPAMTRIATAAGNEVRALPGVRNVGAHMGRASNSDLVASVDSADLWVSIDSGADYHRTLDAIRTAASGFKGVRAEVHAYPNLRVLDVVSADVRDGLVVRVYGRNYDVLQGKAEIVAKTISEVRGVHSARVLPPVVEPTFEIEVDVDKASARGLKPGDIRRAAATILSGITAGSLFEEQKIFDVVVWGAADKRRSASDIQNLLVDGPNDTQVRLGDVADVRVRANPSVIRHDAVSRYVDVRAEVRGTSITSAADDVAERIEQISFPSEHHVEVLGEPAAHEQMSLRLQIYVLAALIAFYFVLQARFDSWRLGAVLFVSLLLPLGGAAIGAASTSASPSVLSLFGALAVAALATRGGTLFIEECLRQERVPGRAHGVEWVLGAAEQRFPALLGSTVAGVLLLAPLLVLDLAAGTEILKPMAAMLVGGVLASGLLNLFVLPALYLRHAHHPAKIAPRSGQVAMQAP